LKAGELARCRTCQAEVVVPPLRDAAQPDPSKGAPEPEEVAAAARTDQLLLEVSRLSAAERAVIVKKLGGVPARARATRWLAVVLLIGIVSTCSLRVVIMHRVEVPIGRDVETLPEYQRSELLYLRADPCADLYVEVDAVVGAEPPEPALQALRAFLEETCRKARVAIRRNPPIARESVAGKPYLWVALEHMTEVTASAAYLYVLFFDSTLYGGPPENPHVRVDSPSAIFVDMACLNAMDDAAPADILPSVLIHEAGYVLGLERGRGGAHCPNETCIMYPYAGNERRTLCAACRRELAAEREQPADPRLRFVGRCSRGARQPIRFSSYPG
jgi:hypothetical protein